MYRAILLFIAAVSLCHLQAQRYQRKPVTIIPSHRMSAASEFIGDINIQKGKGADVQMGDSSATISHAADVITHIGIMLDQPLTGHGQQFNLLCDTKAMAGSAQQLNYAGFFLSDNISNKILFFAVDASGQFLVFSFTDGKGIKVEKNLTPNRNILRGNGQVNHLQLSNRYGKFGDLLAGPMDKAKLYFICNDSLVTSFIPDEDAVFSGAGVIKGGPGTAEISRFRLTEMGYETVRKQMSLTESIPWIADAAPLHFAPFRDPKSTDVYPAPTLSVTGAGKAELKAEASRPQASAGQATVNAQRGQEGAASVRAVEGGARQEQAATAPGARPSVEFLQVEEAALDEAALPPSRREQVRRYFNELRKRFESQP